MFFCTGHTNLASSKRVFGPSRVSRVVLLVQYWYCQSTVYRILPTVYSLKSKVYSLQSTVYSLQSSLQSKSTVYSLQSTVYSQQSTVYSLQFTVYGLRHDSLITQCLIETENSGYVEVTS